MNEWKTSVVQKQTTKNRAGSDEPALFLYRCYLNNANGNVVAYRAIAYWRRIRLNEKGEMEMEKKFDKERVYDERIAPLMKEIMKICREEEIPMAAQFYLQQEQEDAEEENRAMYSSYFRIPAEGDMYPEHWEHMKAVQYAMKYGNNEPPVVMRGVMGRE